MTTIDYRFKGGTSKVIWKSIYVSYVIQRAQKIVEIPVYLKDLVSFMF